MSALKNIKKVKPGKNNNKKIDFDGLNKHLKDKKKAMQPGRVVLK